jgi:pyocin large subunit-like protein
MSFDALAWAAKCRPGTASRKLVLLALADRHNNEVDGAYPSIAWLVDFTDLNRKTIISCLDDLESLGLISDTGERRGDTKQIKLYRLHIGTVPKTEPSQKRNSPKKVAKQSQKRDTDTVRTTTPSTSDDKSSSVETPAFKKEHVIEKWNQLAAGGLVKPARKMNAQRTRMLEARMRENSFEDFLEVFGSLERSKFIHGDNARGWKPTIDFILQPSSFVKLLEGAYDG